MNTTSLLAALALLTPGALAQDVLYETHFDDASGWTLSSSEAVFAVDSGLPPGVSGHPSGNTALRFTEDGYNGSGWEWGRGVATTEELIDLSGSPAPNITFWLSWQHEFGCDWDELSLMILDENGEVLSRECLTVDSNSAGLLGWEQVQRPLDPAWGRVRIRFFYDAWDWVNVGDWGFVIDDVRVLSDTGPSTTLCDPVGQANGLPGPSLAAGSSPTPNTTDLRVFGEGFPAHTYAAGFIGPETAILPAGRGLRCIAPSSQRLSVAPTRADGTPWWTIDLTGADLAVMTQVGMPLFVQAYYRDGGSFNFSEAIRMDVRE